VEPQVTRPCCTTIQGHEGGVLAVDLVVVGLGYVGLPLAQAASSAGLAVRGLDLNTDIVDGLNAGKSHVDDLSDTDIAAMLGQGFRATTDAAVLGEADTIVICVPTPLSDEGGPDLGAVLSATRAIANTLHSGQLVILESTTYPGTTDEDVRPLLEANGLVAGKDFNLAFSPERIDPGNPVYGMKNTPKVVGGHTSACTDRAAAFYARFVDTVVKAAGTREAEMAKLLENTYRHINIALVNELAQFSKPLGIDLWDAIRCASTKPFGFQAFYPGPGVGGHCIPIDPNYLSHRVKTLLGQPFRFVELAQEINAGMPSYVKRRIQDLLNDEGKALKGATVLLLGVTYKPNIADQRESPVRPLARELLAAGANVQFHDPYVAEWNIDNEHGHPSTTDRVLRAQADAVAAATAADVVVVLQPHKGYDLAAITAVAKQVLDTRGLLSGSNVERL
jgi:UDP-N-acetyl-D-glucosamine dehydrogenase